MAALSNFRRVIVAATARTSSYGAVGLEPQAYALIVVSVCVSVDRRHFPLLACLGHLCASGMSIIMLPCAILVTETTPMVPVGPP